MVMIAVVLAINFVAVSMLLLPFRGVVVRDIVGPIRLWHALGLSLAGTFAGCMTGYFRPLPHSRVAR
ncbi:hypothetical protein [Arthrobacter oryzae]|nr:hypothetical protein [Arthrobacter oryzae]